MQITNLYNKEGSLEDARPKSVWFTAQHCILSIGVHIARYMKLLHLARNMHLARTARNMHDSVICADCARHAPVMQNYDRFLSFFSIARDVHELQIYHCAQYADIVKMGVLCAMCLAICTLYAYLSKPPRSCLYTIGTLMVNS